MIYPPLTAQEKKGILRLLKTIEQEDRSDSSGSCGDGSFEFKARELEHRDRITALRVIRDILA